MRSLLLTFVLLAAAGPQAFAAAAPNSGPDRPALTARVGARLVRMKSAIRAKTPGFRSGLSHFGTVAAASLTAVGNGALTTYVTYQVVDNLSGSTPLAMLSGGLIGIGVMNGTSTWLGEALEDQQKLRNLHEQEAIKKAKAEATQQ